MGGLRWKKLKFGVYVEGVLRYQTVGLFSLGVENDLQCLVPINLRGYGT